MKLIVVEIGYSITESYFVVQKKVLQTEMFYILSMLLLRVSILAMGKELFMPLVISLLVLVVLGKISIQ